MPLRRKHYRTCANGSSGSPAFSAAARRSGIAAIWLVLAIPVFAAVLVYVLNIGFLWIARRELENAAASGALAGVQARCENNKKDKDTDKEHGDRSDKDRKARKTAEQFIESNCVLHHPIRINEDGRHKGSKNDQKSSCGARIAFGRVENRTFRIRHNSKNPRNDCACLVELSKAVEGPLGWFSGRTIIHVHAVAVSSGPRGVPRLVDIDEVKPD